MGKLVSIIIPTYNRANLIIQTLESIRNQTYREFECLIIDDGSDDNTEEVVQLFINADNRFQFLERPSNKIKGPNSCRNYGFEKARGEFIYFFDSDDFLKPHALETYINGFNPESDGVLAQVERVDRITGILQDINSIDSENLIEDYFLNKVSYFVCGILWRKPFLDNQPELFDEAIGHHDEWDFNLRMIYAKARIVKIYQPLVVYYQHQHSFKKEIQKANDIQIESAIKARYKHLKILAEQNPDNEKIFLKHIADYHKKTVRNKLIAHQNNWFVYYKKACVLYLRINSFTPLLKMSYGVVSYSLFNKGYSFFD
ncbi:glycosyltransferase family 2 protein [Flavobacterium sp.]|jgi:glycosyltransferase involved in cell wall biosynthesis|uniref:glycosyltransferase family 2 protein n=1 Tax=Flavobacterium sp. TaxID=239 RepID=UPI0037BF257C